MIVVAEESDLTIDGQRSSHYEIPSDESVRSKARRELNIFIRSKFAEKIFLYEQFTS
jgi:hypothetical protein